MKAYRHMAKSNKVKEHRKCTGCGGIKSKKELIRVIRTPENDILIDRTGKKNGRGAYLCDNLECLNKAIRTKGLERSLSSKIPQDIYDMLGGGKDHFTTQNDSDGRC